MGLNKYGSNIANFLPFIYPSNSNVRVSFEFFPPKTEKMNNIMWEAVNSLARFKPEFVSVTYGAGGTTRERTHKAVIDIQNKTGLKAAAHLTCIGASKEEINEIAQKYWVEGIRHIVALRGDVPNAGEKYIPREDGYAYASDLVKGLKDIADFEITVAGYPETHPEAISEEADIDNVKRKIDAGANRIITQYFIDPELFLRYRDKLHDKGINIPVIPGILPITNFKRLLEFSSICNTSIPKWMYDIFEGLDEEPETIKLVAATLAAEQCKILHQNGVNDFHFYTLNRAELSAAICHMLGLRADNKEE